MTDINNSVSSQNGINKIQSTNFEGAKPEVNYTLNTPAEKNIGQDSLNKGAAASAGRAQLYMAQQTKAKQTETPKFDGRIVANVKSDLAEFDKNFNDIQKSMQIYDKAIDKGYTPQQADMIANSYKDEFKA